MNDKERSRALKRARQMEQAGQREQAVALYRRLAEHQEAARVLSGLGHHGEAGNLLLTSLGIQPSAAGGLPGPLRKRAYLAATYLAKGGDINTAVELFVALGEFARGADLLERAGDLVGAERLRNRRAGFARTADEPRGRPGTYGGAAVTPASAQKLEAEGKLELAAQCYLQLRRFADAARIMRNMGQVAEAAEMYAEAGMPYEAAVCYLEAGDTGKGLGNLVRTPRNDPRYRTAAVQAVRVAHGLHHLSFDLENFLAQFVRTDPENEQEREAYFLLAKLYEQQDLLENAKEVLRKLLAAQPEYRNVAQRLAALEEQTEGTQATYERIRHQENSFYETSRHHGRTLDPAMTPLPVLPDLPLASSPGRGNAARAATLGPGGPGRGRTVAGAGRPRSAPPASQRPAPTATDRSAPPATDRSAPPPRQVSRAPADQSSASAGTYVIVAKKASTGSGPPRATGGPTAPPGGPQTTGQFEPQSTPATNPAGSAMPAPPPDQAAPREVLKTDGGDVPPAPAAGADSVFAPGALVADRYRLEGELGQGGMAVVYRATDLELEEEIALKVFLQNNMGDAASRAEGLQRFKQELKVCRQLRHANIVQLYDIGSHGGFRYITMELLRGSTLEDKLERPLPLGLGLRYLIQTCNGLQAAHDKQVIHRDIKPENLFVTTDDVVKVMDFGIAKNWQAGGMTRTGVMAGTPEYMAPEQINSFNKVTAATDLYALGLVAYRMFTSTLPFQHDELVPLLMMHVTERPASPRDHNPDLPLELEQAILKLLEKDPALRFGSCRELIQCLCVIGRKHVGQAG